MKIAIMSDTHDNIPTLRQAMDYIAKEKINLIIHCGDMSSPSMLDEVIFPRFKGEFHMVYGNASDPDLFSQYENKYKKLTIHGSKGAIDIERKKYAFCHFPTEARALVAKNLYSIVFYGHTHKPWEEMVGQTKLVNPGTLAGIFYKATFAVYDTKNDKLELKILEKM